MDKLKGTRAALSRFYEKEAKRVEREMNPVRQKNEKPEEAVVQALLKFFKEHPETFSVNRVESKAVYSSAAGRYMEGQAEEGFSDLIGCDSEGFALYIEVKAPGRRSSIRPSQEVFLLQKIKMRAFAAVVDSVELFQTLYSSWHLQGRSKAFLEQELPRSAKLAKIKADEQKDLFEE
jgi:hypothetical protein